MRDAINIMTMIKNITILDQKIQFVIEKSKKAKHMRITIYNDGNLKVTIPYRLDEQIAENFILQKSHWIIKKLNHKKSSPVTTLPKTSLADYLTHKESVLGKVKEKISYFQSFYNFNFTSISIKRQKTRWGSCSNKGNLNFNYKIIYLNEKLLNYIVAHELCHLKEFNHSKNFWHLLEEMIPDYVLLKKELKLVKL